MITVNIEKAKDIKRDQLRAERAKHFEKNDLVLRDAVVEADEEKRQEALAVRDALRDAPSHQSISEAQTVEELKAITIESILEG